MSAPTSSPCGGPQPTGLVSRRLRALRRLLHQGRESRDLDADLRAVADPDEDQCLDLGRRGLPVGLCRLQGHLAAPADSQARLRLEFLPADSTEARHVLDAMLPRPGRFEITVYIPTWCTRVRWQLRDPQRRSPRTEAGVGTEPAPCRFYAHVHLLRLRYLGLGATLRFVASDELRLRPLLHWLVWFLTQRWRRRPKLHSSDRSPRSYAALCARAEADPLQVGDEVRAHIARMPERPLFTLVLDAADADAAWVQETVDSVTAQLWPHWQLEILGAIAAKLPLAQGERIRIHAAGASPARVIEDVTQGYLIRLRAGDRVRPLALYFVAAEHQLHPEAVLIYTDEDGLNARGERVEPRLKSQWNPELLESHDYIGALAALQIAALRGCGGWREELGGMAYYDLLLRLTRNRSADRIRHVPVIGCSRPAACLTEERLDATCSALQAYWQDLPGCEVSAGLVPGRLRVRRPLPKPAPRVSVIVPTRDGDAHLRVCVDSLLRLTDYPNYELILVDNQSRHAATLAYLEVLAGDPRVRVLPFDAAFNFSAICNLAVTAASGTVVVLLNDDTEVLSAGWLREMVSLAVRPDVGAVGAKLYFPDGTLQHGGVALGIGGVAGHVHWGAPRNDDGYLGRLKAVQAVGAVTGACLAVSRDKYLAVGGMDEAHLRVALNDIDLCLKLAERGWRCVWTPYAELVHHESKSRGRDTTPEKRALFAREHATMRQRWQHRLDADPYYHPWLSRRDLDLRLEDHPALHSPWWDDEPALQKSLQTSSAPVSWQA